MKEEPCCGNCRYVVPGPKELECHRRSPRVLLFCGEHYDPHFSTEWPQINASDWCGEHQMVE